MWGAVAGVIIWFLLFLPVEFPPIPGLFCMGNFMVESIACVVNFGLVSGGLMWLAMRRGPGAASGL